MQQRDELGRFTSLVIESENSGLEPDREQAYKDEISLLRKQLKNSYRQQNVDEEIRKLAFRLSKSNISPPRWLYERIDHNNNNDEIPTLFLSDWHWGEVVVAKEIQNKNKFNLSIAQQRAEATFKNFIDVYTNSLPNHNYRGCVVLLGGDMVSGTIHDELSQTNDLDIMPQVVSCAEAIISGLKLILEKFDRIAVFGVVGNHGRTSKDKRFKRKAYQSFDWLIYQICEKYFSHDEDVKFIIPQGPDVLYKIHNTTYMLSHGDQLGGGGDGIIGMLGPVTRGDHRRRTRQMALGEPYDVLVCGHFHQLTMMRSKIVNGSLKGYDEYAYGLGFPPEPPAQASWLTHPKYGITLQIPIFCAENQKGQTLNYSDNNWIQWPQEEENATYDKQPASRAL